MRNEVDVIVEKLDLINHPEGGYYKETYRSDENVAPLEKRYNGEMRSSGTSIYYLLRSEDFSAFHRLKSDETWYYHEGVSLMINIINSAGELNSVTLGSCSSSDQSQYQVTILAGSWFSANVKEDDSFSLVGCSVSPGFDFKDFELANGKELSEEFPQHRELILKYTALQELP